MASLVTLFFPQDYSGTRDFRRLPRNSVDTFETQVGSRWMNENVGDKLIPPGQLSRIEKEDEGIIDMARIGNAIESDCFDGSNSRCWRNRRCKPLPSG